MECDSMHTCIERAIKNKDIDIPSGYASIFEIARHKNPYNVKFLMHNFFKKFQKIGGYLTIRLGDKVGDPKVAYLRCLRLNSDGCLDYKLNHNQVNFTLLPIRKRKNNMLKISPHYTKVP